MWLKFTVSSGTSLSHGYKIRWWYFIEKLITKLGVPEQIFIGGYKEQNVPGTEFMNICQRNNIEFIRT